MQPKFLAGLLVALILPLFVSFFLNLIYAPGHIIEVVTILIYWLPLSVLTMVFSMPFWIFPDLERSPFRKKLFLAALCGAIGGIFLFVMTTAITQEEGSKFSDLQSMGLISGTGLLYGIVILGVYQIVFNLVKRSKWAAYGADNA